MPYTNPTNLYLTCCLPTSTSCLAKSLADGYGDKLMAVIMTPNLLNYYSHLQLHLTDAKIDAIRVINIMSLACNFGKLESKFL